MYRREAKSVSAVIVIRPTCVGHILKRHSPGATIQLSATVSVGRYFPRSNILPQDTKLAPRHGVCIVDVLHVSNQANDESYVAKGDP